MRRRHSDSIVTKLRKLRLEKHLSFKKLGKLSGIPSTTIRNWCIDLEDDERSETLIYSNRLKRNEIKNSEIKSLTYLDLNNKFICKILTSILYWCEGCKYPATNSVSFVNSDPQLIYFFISLFRKGFEPNEKKFKILLQIHSDQEYLKLVKYWSDLLSIPINRFLKPTITVKKGGKYRRTYMGTCTLRYQDYRVLLKLMGIYEALVLSAKKF